MMPNNYHRDRIFNPYLTTIDDTFILQLLEAMYQDSGIPLKSIQVDGGMTANNLLMQLQADLMGIDVGTFFSAFMISAMTLILI